MGGGSVNNRILTLVQRTHALIISNSQSNQEVYKETVTSQFFNLDVNRSSYASHVASAFFWSFKNILNIFQHMAVRWRGYKMTYPHF